MSLESLHYLATAIIKPASLKSHQHIFLLSHMRANTSLFGHILGSHPEIAGYYEMHIGYHSPRSLVRQKLLYYRDHPVKPGARFIFDKVLHDFHTVNVDVMNRAKASLIFSVREPDQTIKSIVAQFRRERPHHEYCDTGNAAEYYCTRLQSLRDLAETADSYFYFDADTLRKHSEQVLKDVSKWLELNEPLSEKFENFEYSGKLDSGDLSGNLEKRQVIRKNTDYSEIELPEPFESRAREVYQQVTEYLREYAVNR